MKPILAIVGGFALSFGMFIAGMLFALFVVVDEPPQAPRMANNNTAEVWSGEPRAVNTGAQNFERLPAKAGTGIPRADGVVQGPGGKAGVAAEPDGELAVDRVTTAAVPLGDQAAASERKEPQPAPSADDRAAAQLFTAHAEWCSRRYRSYNAETNNYSPYAGGQRQCMSPYWAQYAALTGASTPSDSNQRFVAPPAEEPTEAFGQGEPAASVEYAVDDQAVADDIGPVIDDQHVRDCFSRYRSYRPEDNTYQPFGGGPRLQCE